MSGFNISRRMVNLKGNSPGTSIIPAKETVIDHGDISSLIISASDWGKVHLLKNTGALTITLDVRSGGHVGTWIEFRKRAAGDVTIDCGGSDQFADGNNSISNTVAAQTYSFLRLKVDEAGIIGLSDMLGSWVTT